MRTTLAIDDDVLNAAKAIAKQQGTSLGRVVSDLVRRALHRPPTTGQRNGIQLLEPRHDKGVVTLEIVNLLRDESS